MSTVKSNMSYSLIISSGRALSFRKSFKNALKLYWNEIHWNHSLYPRASAQTGSHLADQQVSDRRLTTRSLCFVSIYVLENIFKLFPKTEELKNLSSCWVVKKRLDPAVLASTEQDPTRFSECVKNMDRIQRSCTHPLFSAERIATG